MKKKTAWISVLLVTAIICGMLSGCTPASKNMKFESEAAMKKYMKGTFEGESMICMIDGNTVQIVRFDELFPEGEDMDKLIKDTLKLYSVEFLDLPGYINKLGFEPEEKKVKYDHEKGIVSFDGDDYDINEEGSLVIGDDVLVWRYEELTYSTEDFVSYFESYKQKLGERIPVLAAEEPFGEVYPQFLDYKNDLAYVLNNVVPKVALKSFSGYNILSDKEIILTYTEKKYDVGDGYCIKMYLHDVELGEIACIKQHGSSTISTIAASTTSKYKNFFSSEYYTYECAIPMQDYDMAISAAAAYVVVAYQYGKSAEEITWEDINNFMSAHYSYNLSNGTVKGNFRSSFKYEGNCYIGLELDIVKDSTTSFGVNIGVKE